MAQPNSSENGLDGDTNRELASLVAVNHATRTPIAFVELYLAIDEVRKVLGRGPDHQDWGLCSWGSLTILERTTVRETAVAYLRDLGAPDSEVAEFEEQYQEEIRRADASPATWSLYFTTRD